MPEKRRQYEQEFKDADRGDKTTFGTPSGQVYVEIKNKDVLILDGATNGMLDKVGAIWKDTKKAEMTGVERLKKFKEDRDQEAVAARLADLREVAAGEGNLLYPLKEALRAHATIGEVCGVMREQFGEYKPPV